MDFAQAVKSGFSNYVRFKGRATRSEFWWWTLFLWVALIAATIVDSFLAALGAPPVIYILGAVVTLLPNAAVWVRRLHDLDKSGWWLLIGFIPLVGVIVLYVWAALKGTAGENRFGADPLGGQGAPAAAAAE